MIYRLLSRYLFTFVSLWLIVLSSYWTIFSATNHDSIITPIVLWMSIPLLCFALAMLLLTWLPASAEPTEWLIPILYPFIVFITVRSLFSIVFQGFFLAPQHPTFEPPVIPHGLHIWPGIALLTMAAYACFDLIRSAYNKISRPYLSAYGIAFCLCFYVGLDSLISPYKPLLQILSSPEALSGQ